MPHAGTYDDQIALPPIPELGSFVHGEFLAKADSGQSRFWRTLHTVVMGQGPDIIANSTIETRLTKIRRRELRGK